jgi:hypothetical protein
VAEHTRYVSVAEQNDVNELNNQNRAVGNSLRKGWLNAVAPPQAEPPRLQPAMRGEIAEVFRPATNNHMERAESLRCLQGKASSPVTAFGLGLRPGYPAPPFWKDRVNQPMPDSYDPATHA